MSKETFFFSSRGRHTRCSRDWSSDVCSSDLRKAVNDRGDDQSAEREGQAMAEQRHPHLPERPARSHGEQGVESNDGGRKDQRQSHDGFQQKFRSEERRVGKESSKRRRRQMEM